MGLSLGFLYGSGTKASRRVSVRRACILAYYKVLGAWMRRSSALWHSGITVLIGQHTVRRTRV